MRILLFFIFNFLILLQYTPVKETAFVNDTNGDRISCGLTIGIEQGGFIVEEEDVEDFDFNALSLNESLSSEFDYSNATFLELIILNQNRFITFYSSDLSPPRLTLLF